MCCFEVLLCNTPYYSKSRIEIKQNDKVTADMTVAFKVLDKIPEKKRGTGAIVCMCSAPGALRENILQIPCWFV